jgi:competence protein ComEA
MKTGWGVALGVICGFLVAGLLLLVSSQPRGDPVKLLPAPSPLPFMVYVSGAVGQPGVYSLPPNSRIKDAIEVAGGLLTEADSSGINLAAPLKDGQRISIPALGSTLAPDKASAVTLSHLVNINTATLAELDNLPNIGPVLAQAIITFREENGPFKAIEEIQKVPGIGSSIFETIKDLITVD